MTVQIYAHRGASAAFAEHTRAAYLQALADGADGVECDLHLTADGHLVLLHDDEIDRTSNGTGAVAGLTMAQLRELDFSSWHGTPIPPEYGSVEQQLLTLPELLDLLSGAGRVIGLAIEFKYGAVFTADLVNATLASLAERGWAAEESRAGNVLVSFMSFHPEAVQYLAARIPAMHLCQLLEEGAALGARLVDDAVAHLAGPGVEYLRAHPGDGARWVEAGRVLRVWTVDARDDLDFCLSAGVAQLTTNRPAEIRAMLTD